MLLIRRSRSRLRALHARLIGSLVVILRRSVRIRPLVRFGVDLRRVRRSWLLRRLDLLREDLLDGFPLFGVQLLRELDGEFDDQVAELTGPLADGHAEAAHPT